MYENIKLFFNFTVAKCKAYIRMDLVKDDGGE